jgi:tRNA A-37 threonylcarbamoyl transferase component Bud32
VQALGASDAREVGPYRLLVELRTDDTGRVLLGTALDGRLAAVTLVGDDLVDDRFRARLRAEIQNAAPGVHSVHVVDGDADATPPWVATGFIPRVSLRTAITRTGPLPESSLLRLADGLAAALAELHDRGLVHGNLTADTVLLTDIGPLLVDSGVARAAGDRTAADDLRALGALVVEAGGADLTDLVAACAAGELSPAALREVIGPLPPTGRPWPAAVRDLAAEESDRIVELITETARRPAPAEPAPPPVEPPPPPGPWTRFFDAFLVSVVTVFVGWVISWLTFGDSERSPLPDHATLVAESGPVLAVGARVAWPLAGFAVAVVCTWFVLLVARPRTKVVPLTVLTGLSLLPVALWGLTSAGLDVTLVTGPSPGDLEELALAPAFVAAGVGGWVAGRLFPGHRRTTSPLSVASLVAVGLAVVVGLSFGWYGVVVADVVPLDVAGVLSGCLAGSIVARLFSPNRVT